MDKDFFFWFKNSGQMTIFLWLCSLQNTDHVMSFWLGTTRLVFKSFQVFRFIPTGSVNERTIESLESNALFV